MVKFLIIDAPCDYMCILGCPTLNAFKAIHEIKIPYFLWAWQNTRRPTDGERMLCKQPKAFTKQPVPKHKDGDNEPPTGRGDDTPHYVQRKWVYTLEAENTPIMWEVKDDSLRLAPVDEVRSVKLFPGDGSKRVRVGAGLEAKLKEDLIAFLRTNSDEIILSN